MKNDQDVLAYSDKDEKIAWKSYEKLLEIRFFCCK